MCSFSSVSGNCNASLRNPAGVMAYLLNLGCARHSTRTHRARKGKARKRCGNIKRHERENAVRLKIIQTGEPVLREPARPLTAAEIRSDEIQRLIADMRETMR